MKSRNKYYQPNPRKGDADMNAGDCVVRAICALDGSEWETVYRELCEIGFELKAMPGVKITYEEYLRRHGYARVPISNKKGSKRPTVNEMATRSKKDGAAYLCDVAGHLATVKDGYILDTWDCGHKSLYAYWTKSDDKEVTT